MYALRQMFNPPVQWNPVVEGGKPLDFLDEGFAELHPAVKATSYMQIHHLIGTSGCSKDEPWWTWTVMGVLETKHGKQVVAPNDWIIEAAAGVFIVLTDAEFKAMFHERHYAGEIAEEEHD